MQFCAGFFLAIIVLLALIVCIVHLFHLFCYTITMAGGALPAVHGTANVQRIEAPVTVKAYLMCAFAAFGGIFFGYDVSNSQSYDAGE